MKLPEAVPTEYIERARKLSATLLCDVMEHRSAMNQLIGPVHPEMTVVGTAVTAELSPGDNTYLHEALYAGAPGYVLVADGKNHTEHAYLGEIIASAAQAIGWEGIVVSGLVRDRATVTALGFPIFAQGFVPTGPLKHGPGRTNVRIHCAGVYVEPGDLVVGDADGVTVVPRSMVADVLSLAEAKLENEVTRLRLIGEFSRDRDQGSTLRPEWLDRGATSHAY